MNSPIPVAQGHTPRPSVMDSGFSSRRLRARGFTLIEMLVALAITLIMMGAVVTLFGVITESVASSRSALEMSDRLRTARNQLQRDLHGATATMQPPLRPENDEGYFEIIEGLTNDGTNAVSPSLSLVGDADDILMLTVRIRGAPFIGRFNGTMIESQVAEVAYFLVENGQIIDATTSPPVRLFTLYRRMLLVVPGLVMPLPYDHFYDENDISIRYEEPGGTPTLFANTLGDLTKRENRFAHYGDVTIAYGDFPFPVDLRGIPQILSGWPPQNTTDPNLPGSWPPGRSPVENAFLAPFDHERIGDDVLLNNVLAFDVQVWDPGAPIQIDAAAPTVALEPRDPGWSSGATPIASGAYVDLGYAPGIATSFSGIPAIKSKLTAPPFVYDTWSLHYENDGVDQNSDGFPDAGTNGLDDGSPGNGIVDDIDEYDTLPPYSAPLRGIRVTIRVYEPDSQQVREAVVVQHFLPE